MANMLQWGLRQMAELENNMISVERVAEFTNCPQENDTESLPGIETIMSAYPLRSIRLT